MVKYGRFARTINHDIKEEKMSAGRFITGLAFTLFALGAAAQDRPPYGQEIGLDLAKKIAAGAAAEPNKNGWRMAIAVVDNHGFLVFYERLVDPQNARVRGAHDHGPAAHITCQTHQSCV